MNDRGQVPTWHLDPTGRHQHRFWDGDNWTALIADNGVTGSDPIDTATLPVAAPSAERTDPSLSADPASSESVPALPPAGSAGAPTPRRKRWPWITAGIVVLVVIVGVASAASKSETKPAPSSADAPSKDDTPPPSFPDLEATTTTVPKPATHKVGDLVTFEKDGTEVGSIRVYSFNPNQPCTQSFCTTNPGESIGALDVEFCSKSGDLSYNVFGWKIQTADNRQWDSPAFGGPEPDLGSGDLAPGLCKRGWVNMTIPQGAQVIGLVWDYFGWETTIFVP